MRIIRFISRGQIFTGQEIGNNQARRIEGDLFGKYTVTDDVLSVEKLLAPLVPTDILCIGLNYRQHAAEGGSQPPKVPMLFIKASNTLNNPGDPIMVPRRSSEIDYEAELVIVIGKGAKNVTRDKAMDYVFGYMNFIDGSARGLPPPGNVFFQMKSRDTFAPIGPYLVTADEIKDPLKLQIRLWNNGVLMQNFNTDDMGHKIGKCIAWLSTIHTLHPGDIVATGTNHRGLNPFMDGDTIELETEGLGRLKFGIKDDLKRSWARKTRLQMHEEAKEKTPGAYPDITPQLSGKYAK